MEMSDMSKVEAARALCLEAGRDPDEVISYRSGLCKVTETLLAAAYREVCRNDEDTTH